MSTMDTEMRIDKMDDVLGMMCWSVDVLHEVEKYKNKLDAGFTRHHTIKRGKKVWKLMRELSWFAKTWNELDDGPFIEDFEKLEKKYEKQRKKWKEQKNVTEAFLEWSHR